MHGPTPDQQREIAEARKELSRYWYTDLKTKELRRRPLVGLPRLLNFFWKKRHTVWQFYWWLTYRRAEEDMIPLSNPIQSDNMPIKGFPIKYELLGGWTIPRKDLKYLKNGPLAAEGLQQILVPVALGWPRVLEFVKQFAPIAVTFASLTTIATNWSMVLAIFRHVKNAF